MTSNSVDVQLVETRDVFHIHASNFVVTAPLPDNSVQITFGDEFTTYSSMTLEQSSPDAQLNIKIPGTVQRIIYGHVKLSLVDARALVELLNDFVTKAEKLTLNESSEEMGS